MRYARLADLVRLALIMQGRADGVSLNEIAETFEVSRRTAERMRDALRETFPQLEEIDDAGGRKRWRLPPGVAGRLADPTVDEIAALHRAAAVARRDNDMATADRLDMLSDRLRARLSGPVRLRLEPDIAVLLEADGVALRPGPRERVDDRVLMTLREAILAGVWVDADHRARATGLLSRDARLGPLAMLLGEGRQYLVAFSAWAGDVRLFALTGFERVVPTDAPFERPADFDLEAWLHGSFGVWREEVRDVVWRFGPEAAPEARRYVFHPTQVMTEAADGGLVVRFRAGGLREMAWHLFRWGDRVSIVEPAVLRETYRTLLEAAAAAAEAPPADAEPPESC